MEIETFTINNSCEIEDVVETHVPDIYTPEYIIKIKIHSSCEIECFVETHLC